MQDFQTALGASPQEGLEESAQTLVQALEGAGDLARLSIAARSQFPTALAAVLDWLQPIEHPDFVVHLLHESGLPDDSQVLHCAY